MKWITGTDSNHFDVKPQPSTDKCGPQRFGSIVIDPGTYSVRSFGCGFQDTFVILVSRETRSRRAVFGFPPILTHTHTPIQEVSAWQEFWHPIYYRDASKLIEASTMKLRNMSTHYFLSGHAIHAIHAIQDPNLMRCISSLQSHALELGNCFTAPSITDLCLGFRCFSRFPRSVRIRFMAVVHGEKECPAGLWCMGCL